MYNDKKPKLIKEQEDSVLLTSLEIKIPLNKIPLLGPFSFWEYSTSCYQI